MHLNYLGPRSGFSPFLMPLREHHYGGGGSCNDWWLEGRQHVLFNVNTLFTKSEKMMLWKHCTQHASKLGKLSSGHSFHSNPKERQCQRLFKFSSVQSFSCVWSSDPMDCSMPGFPVHHQIPEFTQTHVHWVDDAIQPFHPLSSPSDPTFKLSQYQGLFKWLSSSHQVAKVLEFQFQHQSFHRIFKPLHICTHLTH